MKNTRKVFSILSIVGVILIGLLALSACTSDKQYTSLDVQSAVNAEHNTAYKQGVDSVDITSDNQAAVDAYKATEPVVNTSTQISTDTTPAVSTVAYTTKLYLGDSSELTLDSNDVAKLFDGSVDFNGESKDVKETIETTSDLQAAYSGDSSYDSDFGATPYVVGQARNAIAYVYTIKDHIAMSDISTDTPLDITFLGKRMSIISASSGEITFFTTPSVYLTAGQSQSVDGKTVTLADVSDTAAVVTVDGQTDVVNEGSTKTINGVRVYVQSTFSKNTMSESSAVLVVGAGSKKTIQDGDYYDSNEMWVWHIVDDGTNLQKVSISLNEKFNKVDSTVQALKVGDCITLPESFSKLCFDSTNKVDWTKVEVGFDTIDVNNSDIMVTSVKADDDVIYIDGQNVNTVYSNFDGSQLYYKDGSKYIEASDSTATIKLNDADYVVSFPSGQTVITDADSNWVTVDTRALDQQLGDTQGTAETSDVLYNGNDIGTKDKDVLTAYGVQLLDVKNNAENDNAELSLPSEKLEAKIAVY